MFGNGIIVPIVKNKNGDITSLDNYRGITVSTCLSKLFETCILYTLRRLFSFITITIRYDTIRDAILTCARKLT